VYWIAHDVPFYAERFVDRLIAATNKLTEVTMMQTTKQEALDAIQRLPDNVDTEEMVYRLYVLENIRRGQQDAVEGKTQSAEEVLKDIQSW